MITVYGGLSSDVEKFYRSVEYSPIKGMRTIINGVVRGGEEALHYINLKKYGVDSRSLGLYVTEDDVEEAKEFLGDEYVDSLRTLVNKYISHWRKRLTNYNQYISPATGINISYVLKPLEAVAASVPSKGLLYALNIYTAAYAAGVKNLYIVSPPSFGRGMPDPTLLIIKDILKYGYILRTDPPYGVAYFLFGRGFRNYFDKIFLNTDLYYSFKDYGESQSINGVRPIEKICYLIDRTVEPERIILDMYSWLELNRDSKICIVSLNRGIIGEIIEADLNIRKKAPYSLYSYQVDKRVFALLASSYNEAISIINRLEPDYLNINIERESRYRIVDYIKNIKLVSVGEYSLSPYLKLFSGVPLLININGRETIHTCLDYISGYSFVRIDAEAILSDYDELYRVIDRLGQPVNREALTRFISRI